MTNKYIPIMVYITKKQKKQLQKKLGKLGISKWVRSKVDKEFK